MNRELYQVLCVPVPQTRGNARGACVSLCHSPEGALGGPVYFLNHSQMEPTEVMGRSGVGGRMSKYFLHHF